MAKNEFGKLIKIQRKKLGLTQIEFSKAVGVAQGVISKWETGATEPKVRPFFRICKELRLPAERTARLLS